MVLGMPTTASCRFSDRGLSRAIVARNALRSKRPTRPRALIDRDAVASRVIEACSRLGRSRSVLADWRSDTNVAMRNLGGHTVCRDGSAELPPAARWRHSIGSERNVETDELERKWP